MLLRALSVVVAMAALAPRGAEACAVCFGAKGQPVTEAAGDAILFLLGLVGCVLAAIIAFIVCLVLRGRRVAGVAEGAR